MNDRRRGIRGAFNYLTLFIPESFLNNKTEE